MIRYRLYTEDINRDTEIIPILDSHFEGYTIIPAFGVWQGIAEKSVVIEYITDNSYSDLKVRQVCERIKERNNQQAVLYTREEIETVLISDNIYLS